jgi:hypothetical protein
MGCFFLKKKPQYFSKRGKSSSLEKKNKTVAPPAWSKTKKKSSVILWPLA